jgi:trehalose-6-phosphatase
LTSNDAVKWTAQSANTSADLNDMLAINQFIAVGSGGTVITSVDGITWTQQTSNSTGNLTKMLRAENQYLVVDNTGATINSH